MELMVEQAPLAAWLERVANVADTRSPVMLFSGLQLEVDADQLNLSATNTLFSITGALPLQQLHEPGRVATDANRLAELVDKLRPELPVKLSYHPDDEKPRLEVRSGRTRAALPAIDIFNLPRFADRFAVPQLRLGATAFADALAFCEPAIGRNYAQPQLWGVALNFDPYDGGTVFAAASDGRLGAVWRLETTGEAFPGALLPRPLCEEMARLLKKRKDALAITLTENAIRLETVDWTVIGKLVDSEPFPHARWLPDLSPLPITVDGAELAAALERIEAVAEIDNRRLGSRGALLSFDDETILLRDAQATIADEVPAYFAGAPKPVGVNIKHLLTIIETIGAKTIELHTDGPERAIRVQAADAPRGAFVTAAYRIG